MPKYKFTEFAINSTEKKKPTEADKETYIGLEHLDSGTLTVSRWGAVVAPIGEKLLMKKGDMLFGKRRAYQKKVGIAPFDGIFSAHGMVLRPREEVITKEYFPLFISSDYFLNEAIRISVGSLSPTVNWKDLKDLEFNIPTIEEQRRITPLVWAAIKIREAYRNQIAATDNLVKSQFIEMFGEIDESTGIAQNAKYDFIKLGTLTRIRTGKLDANAAVEGGQYPFFSCAAERLAIDKFAYDCECVLVAGNGEFNVKYYQGKFEAYQRTYIIESIDSGLTVPFMYWFMLMYVDTLKRQSVGSVIKYIKLGNLTEAQIPLPPIAVQQRFVALAEQSDKSKLFGAKHRIENFTGGYLCLMKQN